MKRKVTFILAALLLMSGLSWAQTTINWTASAQGYTNAQEITDVTFDGNVSGVFAKGTNSNTPKYYTSGTAIRCYGGNYFTISTSVGNLTGITISFGSNDGSNAITTNVGSYENGTWSGEAESVTFTIGGTTGNRRIAGFSITYATEATEIAIPTFNPASGTEFGNEGLEVTISCETPDVSIYYTTDGSTPDDESTLYNAPFTITETTTIKAIAYDGDDNTSNVATATYTYVDPNAPGTENNPYTVAQARAAIDENTGTQGVYATGIVSAIPTAWSTQYNNITFNFVDEAGDEEYLQAYRCASGTGVNASEVAVGDVVVVYGNLTKYSSTYEFAQGCTLVSLTHPTGYVEAPTFSPVAGVYDEAQNVTISCANANATIYYTLDGTEPTNASTPYTAAINVATTTTIKAIAYVGANASTVATAEYTIVPVANISSITEVGTSYVVKGTVVATNSRGFVMGDGTGYVYYYKNGAVSQSVGDMVKVSGTTGTYGQIIQFTNTATVEEATTSNYNNTPTATVITEVPDYTTGYHLSTYLEFEGELTKSNNSYFITLGNDTIQISYPTSAQGTALTALDGKTVLVKGYFTGINSSNRFTVMLENAEEVASPEPSITLSTYAIEAAAAGTTGTLNVTYANFTNLNPDVDFCDAEGNAADYDWFSAEIDGDNNVAYSIQSNDGDARVGYFRVFATNGEEDIFSEIVTVNQAAYAVDYAILPFQYAGGVLNDFLALDGTSHSLNDQGSYAEGNAPYRIKFTKTGDYLQVKTDSQPGIVTIGVKMLGGANTSTITVQGSTDGVSFTDIQELTISGAQNDILTLETTNAFSSTDRYVRLYFTKGSNVGVGPITIAKVSNDPIIVLESNTVELAYDATSGSFSYSITNPVANTNLEATTDAEWISDITVGENTVTFTTTENEGETDRTATITLSYDGASSKTVTVTQGHFTQEYTLTISNPANVTITAAYGADDVLTNGDNASIANGTEITVSLNIAEGYILDVIEVVGENDQTAIVSATATANVYKFNMPSFNATLNVSVIVVPASVYTLATTIESGKQYIIVGQADGDYYAMGNDKGNNRYAYGITLDGTTAMASIANNGVHEFTITSLGEGYYSIMDATTNGGYLYAASSGSNHLKTETELDENHNGDWKITITNGLFSIVADSSQYTRNVMQFNNSSILFACYGSASQHPVYLYVKDETPVTVTQTTELTAGWNWFSTYIEVEDPIAMLQMLETSIGENGIVIKDGDITTEYDEEWGWFGDLDEIGMVNEHMYMIRTSAACTVELEGTFANPANHEITIVPGWNWIGYPCSEAVNIEDALAGFEAVNGDIMKCGDIATEYDEEWGWFGDIETMVPGQGYMLYSASSETRTLVFQTVSKK